MFCSNCGKEASDDASFCQACGHKLRKLDIQKADNITACWYYLSDNDRKGPVTEKQMADLVTNGNVNRGTMVWKAGYSEWLKIEDTSLKPIVQRIMPASPRNAVSDKWLWALATVPLSLSYILISIFPTMPPLAVSFIVIALNMTFFMFDMIDLKNNGLNVGNWVWLGLVLVPIYLFVRPSKTTKNYVPGIVWCLLYLLTMHIG